MTDIRTKWVPTLGHGDWAMLGAQLESGHDLETAVLISVFSDSLAHADDSIPDGTTDRRGWWGDQGEDKPIGSRLWLLDRSPASAAVLIQARDAIRACLQWLIEDGVAKQVDVFCEYQARSFMGCRVTVTRSDGTLVPMQFSWAWGL